MTGREWAAVRRAYESGATCAALRETYGVTDRALRRHIAQEDWQRAPEKARRERLDRLYTRVLTRLEQAADAMEGSPADADKLSKLLTAAEKLDKLSPAPDPGPPVIRVELGDGEAYAE